MDALLKPLNWTHCKPYDKIVSGSTLQNQNSYFVIQSTNLANAPLGAEILTHKRTIHKLYQYL